jgi:hypothetical protein
MNAKGKSANENVIGQLHLTGRFTSAIEYARIAYQRLFMEIADAGAILRVVFATGSNRDRETWSWDVALGCIQLPSAIPVRQRPVTRHRVGCALNIIH